MCGSGVLFMDAVELAHALNMYFKSFILKKIGFCLLRVFSLIGGVWSNY